HLPTSYLYILSLHDALPILFIIGMIVPIYVTKSVWIYIIMAYLFLASVMPMWLLMQPRDYMTTYMLLGMILGAVIGVLVARPSIDRKSTRLNSSHVSISYAV